jgi:imidazolonepropionase-like amidohydrolase
MRTLLILLLMIPGLTAAATDPGEEAISRALTLGVAPPAVAPPRGDESAGPYRRLVIENAYIFDGGGAPMQGPLNIEIQGDRIAAIRSGGIPTEAVDGTRVIDGTGLYVIPGMVDAHTHLGTPNHAYAGRLTDPGYVMKLYLAHGVTTVRDVGSLMGLEWTVDHKKRSAAGEISSPRIVAYAMFPTQHADVNAARRWVRAVHKKGADGVKFRGGAPELLAAAIEEARKLGMGTAMHHDQTSVARIDVLDSARMGLGSMEHWYGLPEAMFEDKRIQDYPLDYNYSNEQHRFGEAGRLWLQAAEPGSVTWQQTIDELVALDFTLDPTLTIYEANRDLMRAQNAPWHGSYTMPYIMRAFESDPAVHGSYFFDWTTAHEVAWKLNYRRWMQFLNDYKNAGGRVTTGSDAGYIYKLYGFSFVRELELLQEAGFHPLEVLQAATLNGAELLGLDGDIGTIQVGKKADLVLVGNNPVANFKVLYGTGHRRLNPENNKMERAEGIRFTIKDGIVFDAPKLLAEVRQLVAAENEREASQ